MFEENPLLIRRAQNGDKEAMDEAVCKNLGLVRSIALRFRDRGTEYEDLVQIGTIGMMKAIKSFDESYGTAFSTYAVPLIIGEIRRFLRDDGPLKVGRGIRRLGVEAMRQREHFTAENGREPKLSELAELCQSTPEEIAQALEAISPLHSLTEPIGGDEDGQTLENLICDKENKIDCITDTIALKEALDTLPETAKKLIMLRYFKGLSQQKTGEILQMSQVKVSREEKKILAILRQSFV